MIVVLVASKGPGSTAVSGLAALTGCDVRSSGMRSGGSEIVRIEESTMTADSSESDILAVVVVVEVAV